MTGKETRTTDDSVHLSDLFSRSPARGTPIACDLSVLDAPEEHERVSGELFEEKLALRKVEGGYALRYPGTMDYAERLLGFVGRERQCCPFLTFEIAFEPEGRGIWLYLGGDEQVERYLDEQFEDHV